MSDIYKTAFALTMEGKLEQQIIAIAKSFGMLDRQIKDTQGNLNKLNAPRGIFESLSKLKGELGGISAAAIHGNQQIIASYSAMGGKLKSEMIGLKGVTTDVASVMGREMKGAFAGASNEVSSLTRQVGELRSQLRGLGSGGRSIRRGGGGGHGGGGILDTIAMGPSHSGIYAGMNIEHSMVGGMLEAGGALQRQLNLYRLGGASEAQVTAARQGAFRSSVLVPDVGVSEQMKLYRELASATGDDAGALKILPQVAKTSSVMEAVTGRKSEEDMKRLFKFIELRGIAIDEKTHKIDPAKFGAELNYATKAVVAAQGLITSNDMLQFAKQAGSMAKGMSGDELFTSMLAAMEDMGGSRAGTSLTAVGRQFLGGIMTSGKVGRLDELGLLNKGGVDRDNPDKKTITDPTKAVKGYEVLTNQGFVAFMDKVFRPALAAHGITDRQRQNEELYRSVGTDTARRLMGLMLSGHEQVQIVGDRYKKAMGGTDGYDKIFGAGADYETSKKAVGEAFENLKTALSDAPGVATNLMSLAKGIASFADMMKDHPALGTATTLGGVGASASLLGYGAFKTATGFGLPAAATQLTTAAVHLEAAAVRLGGGSVAADAAKAAPAAGVLTALGLTGIGISTIAAGAFAGYATAKTLPGIARREGLGAIDPATGEHIGSGVPQTTPWLRDWMKSWFESPAAKGQAEEAGKKAGEATSKAFTGTDFAGAGSKAGASLLQGLSGALSRIGAVAGSPINFRAGTPTASAGITPVRAEAPTAGPPPRQKEEVHVHNVYMDGEKIERHVSRRMVAKAKYPTSVGGTDNYGVWHGPGTAGTKVA